MQLRVARLCLDCEELHADKCCPRCASASFAYLTNWLPCEERRRFERIRTPVTQAAWWLSTLVRRLRGEVTPQIRATRRTDAVPQLLNLDTLDTTQSAMAIEPQKPGTEQSPAGRSRACRHPPPERESSFRFLH